MRIDKVLRHTVAGIAMASTLLAASPAGAEETQYMAIPSIRVGPYNAMGTGYFGGEIDYLNYVNMKHGGVNGVKLVP